jgi:hypothetical protein
MGQGRVAPLWLRIRTDLSDAVASIYPWFKDVNVLDAVEASIDRTATLALSVTPQLDNFSIGECYYKVGKWFSQIAMREPPEGIEINDKLSQKEIESAFNTGFGYRISGINPRRDEQDRRYVLVFANEDGPYSDSVT